jgi:hypothetical protein
MEEQDRRTIEEKLEKLEQVEEDNIRKRQMDTFGYGPESGRVRKFFAKLFHGVDTYAYSSYNPIFLAIIICRGELQKEYMEINNGQPYVPIRHR